jgi:hypothetical protein
VLIHTFTFYQFCDVLAFRRSGAVWSYVFSAVVFGAWVLGRGKYFKNFDTLFQILGCFIRF